MDWMMPVLTGSETAGRLKNDPAVRQIPIIFLTGMAVDEETKSPDMPYCLAKPVDLTRLISCIEERLAA